jgi:hypothetical protein
MSTDIGTIIGDAILLGLLGLYLWWMIVQNKQDWFDRPRRPTRHVSLLLTCIGAIAVALHVIGFTLCHADLFWWSMPFLAFMSSFVLGVAKPEFGIGTAYRFMAVAGPASVLGCAMGFFPLLALEAGGCALGFRLGEALHRSTSKDNELLQ